MYKIICVVGARPNFMKIAPIMKAFRASSRIEAMLVHTGQHYDAAMKYTFFDQLAIPTPDIDLEVGSATHAIQTAEIMRCFEPVLDQQCPNAIIVVGDVNSTIACALVAVKKGIPVFHIEAGLRSYDRSMPEEINRVLTDQISELLFTTEQQARDNLLREGILEQNIHFVGNVMIDTLFQQIDKSIPPEFTLSAAPEPEIFRENGYALLTLHRPSNVDTQDVLNRLLKTMLKISETLPLIFPIHPRTRGQIEKNAIQAILETRRILTLPPLGYQEMLGLMKQARVVITDSGGIQEETTALGIPCITLRDNTERPVTITEGTNTIVGTEPQRILDVFNDVIMTGGKSGRIPEKWDGKAAQRIVAIIEEWFSKH